MSVDFQRTTRDYVQEGTTLIIMSALMFPIALSICNGSGHAVS
jgi:hypothetical protein